MTKLKRNCKNQYYLEKCCEYKSNTKALWNVINKVSRENKDKSCVIGYIKDGDISYNNPKQIAKIFNDHFSNVGTKYAKAIKNSKKSINFYLSALRHNAKTSFWTPVTAGELRTIVNKLPSKKSSGYDNLDNCLLKQICPCFLDELVYLFNKLLRDGIVVDWIISVLQDTRFFSQERYWISNKAKHNYQVHSQYHVYQFISSLNQSVKFNKFVIQKSYPYT